MEHPAEPDRARAARFFEEQLPAVVRERGDLFDHIQGSLAVFVDGTGAWTVSFGAYAAKDAVRSGADLDADCVAVFSTPMFAALLDGVVEDSRPVVIGDVKLLERLGSLLQEPQRGPVQARLSIRTSTGTSAGTSARMKPEKRHPNSDEE